MKLKKLIHFIKSDLSPLEKLGIAILLVGHLLAAYHSFGFHHPDEHFQIFEFAHAYLGLSNTAHLPWEYTAQIRPWFQPFLHVIVMKAALVANLYDPFKIAFLCRAIYGLLNVWMLFTLWRSFRVRYMLNEIWWPLIAGVWFFPYIHVRTSSENLAGIFLGFAFLQLWKPLVRRGPHWFKAGLLFGFAFLARYQIALGLVGIAVVLFVQARRITLDHLKMGAGFVIPVVLGVVLDRIGYGNWVFTAYRYFTVNLVDGIAATFNPYPWYQYFIWILQLNPFVSIPLFAGFATYLVRHRRDVLSAFTFTFFFLHLFITNKEYRFLFPILNFVPFMVAVAYDGYARVVARRAFWISYALVSFLAFYASAMRGAAIHTLWPSETYSHYHEPGDRWVSNRDFKNLAQTAYYNIPDINLTVVHSSEELVQTLRQGGKWNVIIDGKLEDALTQELVDVVSHGGCWRISTSYPDILFAWREQFPIIKRLIFKGYYQCDMGAGA